MKKTIILALALAVIGGAAYANLGALDTVPAATLLVPYIVVDANAQGVPNVNGYTTLTVVTNVSSAKQIIHVTVYNAMSKGVVDFDEVLSGYDVWSINWRDLVTGDFENFDTGVNGKTGFFPTSTVGYVPSPYGPSTNTSSSQNPIPPVGLPAPYDYDKANSPTTWGPNDTTVGTCGFPWGNLNSFAGIIVQKLQKPMTYDWSVQDTDCDVDTTADRIPSPLFLSNLTVSPLFFYATIDTVSSCNGFFPDADSHYWDDNSGAGYNTKNNVLTGYDFYMNPTQNYSESLPTVNIEASAGTYTNGFYTAKRLAAGARSSSDDREPLPTAWAFNYFNSNGATTQVGVFKTYHELDAADTLVLACRPYVYYAWDENENSKARTTTSCPSGLCFGSPEPNLFPFETQKVDVTTTNFDGLMAGNGWMMLVFDPSVPLTWDADYDGVQTYVFAKYNFGAYSTAVQATVLGNYWWNSAQVLPALNTNAGLYE
jgi:hypothetical protein